MAFINNPDSFETQAAFAAAKMHFWHDARGISFEVVADDASIGSL